MEKWKQVDVPSRHPIEVSDMGNVRYKSFEHNGNVYENVVKKPTITRTGHCEIRFWDEGKFKTFLVHRAVATLFVKNPEGARYVRHKDGDKENNSTENLYWTNEQSRTKRSNKAKLTDASVIEIRKKLSSKKYSNREIAEQYDICPTLVSHIKAGRRWSSDLTN